MSARTYSIGFIGAGNMAEAIARGVLTAGLFPPEQMICADPSAARRELFSQQLRIQAVEDSALVAGRAQALLLAVKPQKIAESLAQIKPTLAAESLLISIVAAVSTRYIESNLSAPTRVVRVMPNTPVLVGAGASGLCKGARATDNDLAFARRIFGACGLALEVPENLMNAVTSLSGSGPAYVFFLAEALSAAGVKMGLDQPTADSLARQTIIGAGQLLAQSPDSAAQRRRQVTSPGGFTEAAIHSLESQRFFEVIAAALAAAEERGRQLSR